MSRLAELEQDWQEDQRLRALAFDTVEELARHLQSLHRAMLSGQFGPIGYLYTQQVKRNASKLKTD